MSGHKEWLNKANSDLRGCKKLIQEDDNTLDLAAYHTQQCAEKALKAFLVFQGKTIKKTHDLEYLIHECIRYDILFKSILTDSIDLNPYAIDSRYPDDRFNRSIVGN